MSLDRWPGVRPWNRTPTALSSSSEFDITELQPREYYVGQLGAAIRTRANRVAALAKENVKTRLFDDPEQELDESKEENQHPYLKLINESPSFANTYFWKALSTFLDLTGTAYIFVLRNAKGDVKGSSNEFKIINPYNLTKVIKGSDPSKYRYVETRGAMWREIPEDQLIVINSLNPFNLEDGFALVDMAKDDQFSIQQARSYSRSAVKNNVGQRGMLTPEQVLSDEDYTNFENAVASKKDAGKFLTTNAPVKYQDMQIDLEKLALEKINKISTDVLIAVTGASKTILGIEESGTTRETARVQRELFAENHGIPQLDDILDALNQDYKNSYPDEYQGRRLEMYVESPLKVDKDADKKDAEIEKLKAETAKVLIDTGYEAASVGRYLDLDDELVFEERQTQEKPKLTIKMPPGEEEEETEEEPAEENSLLIMLNRYDPGLEPVVKGFESTLANQIANIEGQAFHIALPKLLDQFAQNQLTDPQKTIAQKERERLEKELAVALAVFGGTVLPLFAGQTISKRFTEFNLPADFTMTSAVNKTIKASASKAAKSHMKTFLKASFEEARKAGLEGLSREGIVSRLTGAFPDLSRVNATRIARTESYKVVNLAQYEADKQFLEQNGITGQARKRWTVQSNNPCPYCKEMDGTEVPFKANFLDVGDSIKAEVGGTTKEMHIGYEPIQSGTVHPNCSCTYELVVGS